MNWEAAKPVEQTSNAFVIPKTWLFVHYYEALTILFRVENALRVFVYTVLKNKYGLKWEEITITSDDVTQSTIAATAKRRVAQANNFGYLGFNLSCPIMHLTSGELIRIITSEAYWPLFKGFFLRSKEIIKSKLDEIGSVRNALAHFRPITSDDVAVIKQNAKHVLGSLESELDQMFKCPRIVPTNTSDKWYKELATLGIEAASVTFKQTSNGHWVSVVLTFQCPVVKITKHSDNYVAYHPLNLLTPELLNSYPALREHITYLSEDISHPNLKEDLNIQYSKEVRMVFSKDSIIANHDALKKTIEQILRKIAEEIELLKQDILARGTLIEVVQTYAYRQSGKDGAPGRWSTPTDSFICKTKQEDPPEYWGQHPTLWSDDYVSSIHQFPWMPVAVAEEDTPF